MVPLNVPLTSVLEQAKLATPSFLSQFSAVPCHALFEDLQDKQLFSESTLHQALGNVQGLKHACLDSLEPDPSLEPLSADYIPLYETDSSYGIAMSNPFKALPLKTEKTLHVVLVQNQDMHRHQCQSTSVSLETLLLKAHQRQASDIHFFENAQHGATVFFREIGELRFYAALDETQYRALKQHVKLESSLDLSLLQRPQDGQFPFHTSTLKLDLRVSFLPTIHGEDMVCRLFSQSHIFQNLDDLGVGPRQQTLLHSLIQHRSGLILVTGPTGSGKTTTLYTLLRLLQAHSRGVIVTLEDPVEKQLSGLRQSSINPDKGYAFANGLKAILRQDPDVIMVGEIRDAQTAQIALEAAYTGHLVLSSLHTHDVHSTLLRLKHFNCDPFLVQYALRGIVSQQLCKTPQNSRELQQELLMLDNSLHAPIFETSDMSQLGTYLS